MRYLTLCAAGAMLLAGCAEPDDKSFPGYAEGEYVRVGAPLAGTLLKLAVRTGDTPTAGAPAFVLEQASESAARQEAQSRVERAQALLADLQKGARSDEQAAIAADLKAAEAALALSRANLERDRKLVGDQFISRGWTRAMPPSMPTAPASSKPRRACARRVAARAATRWPPPKRSRGRAPSWPRPSGGWTRRCRRCRWPKHRDRGGLPGRLNGCQWLAGPHAAAARRH
ncbi:hypothetical protein LP419_16100 [Massilia sp. H-1]|nr:hypothetical protein LP419_16100 [Massilia sp. H-1]